MAMNTSGHQKGPKGDINVTPLIDVVLVLLIIFMVLVPSMLKELTANVPNKDKSDAPPDPTVVPIVVEYTAKRELSVNQESVAPAALAEKISERLKFKSQKYQGLKRSRHHGRSTTFTACVASVTRLPGPTALPFRDD